MSAAVNRCTPANGHKQPGGRLRHVSLPERGSATITAVGIIALAAMLAAVLALSSAVFTVRLQAQTAADLGALAGAQAMASSRTFEDATAGCAAATSVVERNGAHVSSCQGIGSDLRVTVTRSVSGWTVPAAARAGPLDTP